MMENPVVLKILMQLEPPTLGLSKILNAHIFIGPRSLGPDVTEKALLRLN